MKSTTDYILIRLLLCRVWTVDQQQLCRLGACEKYSFSPHPRWFTCTSKVKRHSMRQDYCISVAFLVYNNCMVGGCVCAHAPLDSPRQG